MPSSVRDAHADGPLALEEHLQDARPLVDLDAVLAGVFSIMWSNSLRSTCQVCDDSCGLWSMK